MLANSSALAKINLHLHITGRADNGYHLLDSLVAFTSLSDDVHIQKSDGFHLNISGNPDLASVCAEQDNLISRATYSLATHLGIEPNVRIDLNKKIPLGGGLGGGSADAATTLRLLKDLWNISDNTVIEKIAAKLGSDIVACLYNKPVIMRDTGNRILNAPALPKLYGLLVNPNMSCSTPEVYKAYAHSQPTYSSNITFPASFHSAPDLCAFLTQHTRNDLTDAAISVAPAIKTVLDALSKLPHCILSRLSGSGATCFAIFENAHHAQQGYAHIRKDYPHLWVELIDIN